jgi:hypothetical protein
MPESNVPQCPEPIPYSNESYGYAEIDFKPTPHAVFDNQVKLVHVDKILANQLGEITQPVQDVLAYPNLASVGDNNAKPLLTSYAGADISLPTTLASSDVNTVSINDISQPNQPTQPTQPTHHNQPTQPTHHNQPNPPSPNLSNQLLGIKPIPMAPMILPVPSKNKERFENNPIQSNDNLANFIPKNNPIGRVEHFGPNKNEFFANKHIKEFFGDINTMDNIVFIIAVIALGYYYVSTYHPEYLNNFNNINISTIPIISQLTNPNVTTENKIIIVVAIVIGLVLVSRMLK